MNYRFSPRVQLAAKAVKAGGVIAYPTEAVWGLGCNPYSLNAVQKILRLKNRAQDKGLILVAANIDQFGFILRHLPESQRRLLAESWPAPTTWLVPHFNLVPEWVRGCHNTVALRVSAHPTVKALCQTVGGAIVSTSANPQGLLPAKYEYRARQYFGDEVVYSNGQVNLQARPSIIRDLETERVIRS